jgi:FKBP-type peptidyl-prolyl cis-trans isomerase
MIAIGALFFCFVLGLPPFEVGAIRAPDDVASPPPGATTTPSGITMRVLKPGTGKRHPEGNDCVKLHFTAWERDGSFLANTRQWDEPQNQCLSTAMPGVAEALTKMVVGEQARVWVPASLTFTGDDDDRPPLVDATFDLELFEIVKAPPTPASLKSPPPGAQRTPSGLAIEVLKKGRGKQRPAEQSQVKLDFSGWTADGKLVESSVMARHPAVFEMTGVMPGWREALSRMVAGDKVRVWIPRDLAFGSTPRRGQPKGDLVYELELLEVR